MHVLVGPLHIVCGVLFVAGVAKLRNPLPTERALYALGVKTPGLAVRGLGIVEAAVAVSAVLTAHRALIASVAVLYLGFSVVTAAMLRSGGGVPCGCFGASGAPTTVLHLVVNVCSVSVAAAATRVDSLRLVLNDLGPAQGLAYGTTVVAGIYAMILTLTVLPQLAPTQRGVSRRAAT